MNLRDPLIATVDAEGRLILPPGVAEQLGLVPGASAFIDPEQDAIRVRRPGDQLAKVYIEPTTRCNLTCRTCIRNAWEEPPRDMSEETFDRLLDGLRALSPLPTVFFGGFGEPLAHPRIVDMVARVKALGVPRVELITNACLLSADMSRSLIQAGLDSLWVSLDGIRPESYSDVRLGALLPEVLANLKEFKAARRELQLVGLSDDEWKRYAAGVRGWHDSWRLPDPRPGMGIVFVAMRRNIADLSPLIAETYRLGARQFIVSNVIPYTEELVAEILYDDQLRIAPLPTFWDRDLKLPPMDIDDTTRRPLHAAIHGRHEPSLVGADLSGITRRCPFVEAGSVAVSSSGAVSPCLALMHSHDEYVFGRKRRVERHVLGEIRERSLGDIWTDRRYVLLRRRVQEFDFSPCIACGGCPLFETNEEDCEGDESPRCGGCLWAHGLIRCP